MSGRGRMAMADEIKRMRLSEDCLGQAIVAEALVFAEGVHVSVYGGDRPHIGAVSVAMPGVETATTQFPGHRDAATSETWATALSECGFAPVVVEAGVHYEGLTKAGIQSVLAASGRMLEKLLSALRD